MSLISLPNINILYDCIITDPWRSVPEAFIGKTPLICSFMNGNIAMVRALLEAGCSLIYAKEWLTGPGRRRRDEFINNGHADVIKFIENSLPSPHRLTCLCKSRICALAQNKEAIQQLPLPQKLRRYLVE